jgi:methyl-accepting chemotaxis protein
MPALAPSNYKLERRWSLTHFLIGVFGAMAIIGVMAKIFTFEAEIFGYLITWKPIAIVGFLGEAFVFILMGMMREFRYVPVDEDTQEENSSKGPAAGPGAARTSEWNEAEHELTQEAERLAQQIRDARETLAEEIDVLQQFRTLREDLQEAGDNLSSHSEALGTNMEDLQALYDTQTSLAQLTDELQQELADESKGLGEEIAETREAMRALRDQFNQAARRFEQFNGSLPSDQHPENGRPDRPQPANEYSDSN